MNLNDNETVIFKEKDGLKYMQFRKLLELGIRHFYTLKGEGINFLRNNEYEKASFNLARSIYDIPENKLVVPYQTHTDNVECVDENTKNESLDDVDGVITNSSGIALIEKNADCILLFFYDPVKKVIANVHSGWRGTFKKISENAVKKMTNVYGSKPEDILCFINPSIRKDHFEVDIDVMEMCKNIFEYTNKVDKFIEKGRIFEGKQKYNIDTVLINRILLENLGLKQENIIDCGICSMCHSDEICSARAEGPKKIRAISLIMM